MCHTCTRRYNSRAVEMVDRIEALCQAIEAVTSDTHTSEARSREVAELIGQRDKAEEEYLALTPYYHTVSVTCVCVSVLCVCVCTCVCVCHTFYRSPHTDLLTSP